MDFLKKYRKHIFILIIVILFAIPSIVQLLFWIGNSYWGIPSNFNQSDILAYICSFIAICATAYLGFAANKINERITEQNKELLQQNQRIVQLEEKDRLPMIDLVPADSDKLGSHFTRVIIEEEPENSGKSFYYECTNISKQYICDIRIIGYTILIGDDVYQNYPILNSVSINSLLRPDEKKDFEINQKLIIKAFQANCLFNF